MLMNKAQVKFGVSMSKVSVIVPIYNAGKKLKFCLRSILNQTFKDIELILINDGSTDESLEICEEFSKFDIRIKLIDKKNEGVIVARRVGIEKASSDYIMFVDADDWIHNHMIEIIYLKACDSSADIVVCNSFKVLNDRFKFGRKNTSMFFSSDKIFTSDDIRTKLVDAYLHGHPFPASLYAKLYRRDIFANSGKYLSNIKFFGEDLYLNIELFLKANKILIIKKALYYYRVGGYTYHYMDSLLNDAVTGYKHQKDIINEYYVSDFERQIDGISIMLLNTFITCLGNCFLSNRNKNEIKNAISTYVKDPSIQEVMVNSGVIKYFDEIFLNAIVSEDINFLYLMGKRIYNKVKIKRIIIRAISN